MALYSRGTASMDADGTVHGTDTKWKDQLALIRVGATIVFLEQPIKLAVISDIVSDTEMKAISTDGQTAADGKYVILLSDSLTVNGLAQNVAETLRYYQSKETEIAAAIDLINQLDMTKLEQIVTEVNQAKSDAQDAQSQAELARDAANAARDETNSIKDQAQGIVDGAVDGINAAKDQAITDVGAKESAAVMHIDTEEAAAIQAINDAKGDLSGYVNDAQTAAQTATSAKNDAQLARNDAVSSKDAAAVSAQEAKDAANSVNAENLLTKDGNLAGLTDPGEARGNLKLTEWGLLSDAASAGVSDINAISVNCNYSVPPKNTNNLTGTYPFEHVQNLDDGWLILETRMHADPNYGIQRATQFTGNSAGSVSVRCKLNGAWGSWGQERGSHGYLANVMLDRATFRSVGTASGGAGALVGGGVKGGGYQQWRDRATGLLVEAIAKDAAVSIFKSVMWGQDWIGGLDCVLWGAGGKEMKLYTGGAEFTFNHAGVATAAQWTSTSDIRLKTNLNKIESATEKVERLVGYTYYKRNTIEETENSRYEIEAGIVAQDLEMVLPEAVLSINSKGELDPKREGIKSVNYAGVAALLVNAFNEQKKRSDEMELKINEMIKEIDEIKKLLSK